MKKLFVATIVTLLAAASAARADVPNTTTTQLCKSGPAVAACPDGTVSNIGVAYSNTQTLTTGSVANPSNNYNSVAGVSQNNNQSVVPVLNHTSSVAISPSFNNNDSVAYHSGSNSSSTSVAYGGSSASSQSVVH